MIKQQIENFLQILEGRTIGTEERYKCLEYLEESRRNPDLSLYLTRLEKLYKENKEELETDENWLV